MTFWCRILYTKDHNDILGFGCIGGVSVDATFLRDFEPIRVKNGEGHQKFTRFGRVYTWSSVYQQVLTLDDLFQ